MIITASNKYIREQGCLLVTSDENLCRKGCIVVRDSMKKGENSWRSNDLITIDVCNTFYNMKNIL